MSKNPRVKALVYDVEIKKCIPDRKHPNKPGLQYCKGWGDHADMGISVICAYDYYDDRYRVFLEDNFHEFSELAASRECVIGFNSISFDDRLCAAHGIEIKTLYDLLCEVRTASGQPAQFTPGKTRGGYTLGEIAKANLGVGKSGHGEHAPEQWQRGDIGAVIDYCLDDVRLTRKLFEMSQSGTLTDPVTGLILPTRTVKAVHQTQLNLAIRNPQTTLDYGDVIE